MLWPVSMQTQKSQNKQTNQQTIIPRDCGSAGFISACVHFGLNIYLCKVLCLIRTGPPPLEMATTPPNYRDKPKTTPYQMPAYTGKLTGTIITRGIVIAILPLCIHRSPTTYYLCKLHWSTVHVHFYVTVVSCCVLYM